MCLVNYISISFSKGDAIEKYKVWGGNHEKKQKEKAWTRVPRAWPTARAELPASRPPSRERAWLTQAQNPQPTTSPGTHGQSEGRTGARRPGRPPSTPPRPTLGRGSSTLQAKPFQPLEVTSVLMAEKRGRRQKGDEGPSQLPAPPSHACTTGTNPASLRTFSRAFAGGKQSFPGGTRVQDPLPPSSRGITPRGASRQPPPPLSDHWGKGTSSHMCECSTCTGRLRYLQTDLAGRPG